MVPRSSIVAVLRAQHWRVVVWLATAAVWCIVEVWWAVVMMMRMMMVLLLLLAVLVVVVVVGWWWWR